MPANLQSILRLEVPVIVRIGECSMKLGDVLELTPGSIVELPRSAGDDLQLMVDNKPIGAGRAVKVGENFGIRVTRMGDVRHRLAALGGNPNPPPDGGENVER